MLFSVIHGYIKKLYLICIHITHKLVISYSDRTDWYLVMTGKVMDNTWCTTFHFPLVSLIKDILQTAPVNIIRQRSLISTQVVQGGKKVPLNNGHIAIRSAPNPRSSDHKWNPNTTFEAGVFALLKRTVIAALFLSAGDTFTSIIGSENDIGISQLVHFSKIIHNDAYMLIRFFQHSAI